MFELIGAGLKLLAAPVAEYLKGRADLQRVKEEGKVRIEEAKTRAAELRAERTAETEANYDLTALQQQQYSWKDEYLLVLWTLPAILSFVPIPEAQTSIQRGWAMLNATPLWYVSGLLGMVAATFGLRWWMTKNQA